MSHKPTDKDIKEQKAKEELHQKRVERARHARKVVEAGLAADAYDPFKEVERLQEMITSLSDKITQLRGEIHEYENAAGVILPKLEKLTEANTSQSQEITLLSQQISKLTQQVETSKQKNSELSQLNSELSRTVAKLEDAIASLTSEVSNLREREQKGVIEATGEEIEALHHLNQQLKANVALKEKTIGAQAKNIDAAKSTITELQNTVGKLSENIKSNTQYAQEIESLYYEDFQNLQARTQELDRREKEIKEKEETVPGPTMISIETERESIKFREQNLLAKEREFAEKERALAQREQRLLERIQEIESTQKTFDRAVDERETELKRLEEGILAKEQGRKSPAGLTRSSLQDELRADTIERIIRFEQELATTQIALKNLQPKIQAYLSTGVEAGTGIYPEIPSPWPEFDRLTNNIKRITEELGKAREELQQDVKQTREPVRPILRFSPEEQPGSAAGPSPKHERPHNVEGEPSPPDTPRKKSI